PWVVAEALECIGGNGYIEDASVLPRLYRESPLNGIWEGAGNIQALDVLRAVERSPESLEAFFDEIGGPLDRLDFSEGNARRVVERLARAVQQSLLVRYAPEEVADAFATRKGRAYGSIANGLVTPAVIDRHGVRV